MAVNTLSYFPNPAGTEAKVVGTELTALGAGAATLYTAPANKYPRVRNFTICISFVSDGSSRLVSAILKIGTAKYTVSLDGTAAGDFTKTFSSKDLGFDGAWLQSADTITFQAVTSTGTPTGVRISCAVSIDDYTG